MAEELSHWRQLGEELKTRIARPCGSPTFVLHFIGVIILTGGLGILIPLVKPWIFTSTTLDNVELSRAMTTYSLAILAASFTTLMLTESILKSLRMLGIVVVVIGIIFSILCYIVPDIFTFGFFGTTTALVLWWVANADNAQFHEEPLDPIDATGGDVEETGLAGDFGDIKH